MDEEYQQTLKALETHDENPNIIHCTKIIDKSKTCPQCFIQLDAKFNKYICSQCGLSLEFLDEHEEMNKETSASSTYAAPLKVTNGNRSKVVGVSYTNANTTKIKRNAVYEEMHKFANKEGCNIPMIVFNNSADYFCTIHEHITTRSKARKGTQAACVYRFCIMHECFRRPGYIVALFNITNKDFSKGQKIIDKLISEYRIDNPLPINYHVIKMKGILNEYCQLLDIPEFGFTTREISKTERVEIKQYYHKFVLDLVRFARKYHISSSSILSSKCAGAVYCLVLHCTNLKISVDTVVKKCECAKTTAKRFSDAVTVFLKIDVRDVNGHNVDKAIARLKHIFNKNGIPLKEGPRVRQPRKVRKVTVKADKKVTKLEKKEEIIAN